jgi:hypothetical protein
VDELSVQLALAFSGDVKAKAEVTDDTTGPVGDVDGNETSADLLQNGSKRVLTRRVTCMH